MRLDEKTAQLVKAYHLPRFHEIPDVGLYLNQVMKYINSYVEPINDLCITESMISNYVKMQMVARPVKKLYHREQIAGLLFISIAKSVLSLENLQILLDVQRASYDSALAYDYFCDEYEKTLRSVFGVAEVRRQMCGEEDDWTNLFQTLITTVARKIYLEYYFSQHKTDCASSVFEKPMK